MSCCRPSADRRRLATAAAALAGVVLVLAGCGQTASPSPSPEPTLSSSPAATATPPSATATPAAPDAAAEAALDAFFVTVAEPEALSFHLRQEATLETGGVPFITADYDLDVAGTEFMGAMSVGGLGSHVALEVVLVDDGAWVKVDDGEWTEADATDLGGATEDVLDVWRYVAPRDDLQLEDRDAEGNFRFRSTTPLPYATGSMRESGMTGQITEQVLVLTPEGMPVSLELAIEAAAMIGEQELELTGTTTIEFSRWGEPMTIEPPIR